MAPGSKQFGLNKHDRSRLALTVTAGATPLFFALVTGAMLCDADQTANVHP